MSTLENASSAHHVVNVDDFILAIDAMDSLGLGQGRAFEPEILAALQRWVRRGDTVVDIGANIGYFTAHLARLVGADGCVHAFEPDPANFALLVENMRANKLAWVQLHQAAVGAQPGKATLHISEYNGGMHRLYDSVCCTGPGLDVAVQTVDQLLVGSRIDLIKIDIEGYEPAALMGAQACLRANPEMKIVSEYCPASMLEAGGQPSAMLNWLREQGFGPHELNGVAVDIDELLQDALRYETYGQERFLAACQGLSNPEILDTIVRLSTELGCTRPVIENLLFMR